MAAGEALRRRAAGRPLFVVLDDAHFASDVLLSALEYAALEEGGAPVWICALGRPAFEQQTPSWGERAGRREQHRIGPLDAASAATLCRRLLAPVESVADSAVQRLVDRAQAIPLLLVELVRGLRREGLVRRSPKGEAWYLATDELDRLPDLPLIEWLARSELDTLAPTLRGHVRLVALLGERVTHADIDGLLRRLEHEGGDLEFPLDGRVATQRLLASGIVVEDRDGRIGFRHALVREAIARDTPAALRRRIHHAAALHYLGVEAQATLGADERTAGPMSIGWRSSPTTRPRRGWARSPSAPTSISPSGRAPATPTPTPSGSTAAALEQPGAASPVGARGGLPRARADALPHRPLPRRPRPTSPARASWRSEQGDVAAQIEVLLDEATALDWMDEYKSSEDRVEEAEALLPGVQSPLLEARVLLGVGRSASRFSRNDLAAALLEQAAAAAEPLGEDGYETLVIALMLARLRVPGAGPPGRRPPRARSHHRALRVAQRSAAPRGRRRSPSARLGVPRRQGRHDRGHGARPLAGARARTEQPGAHRRVQLRRVPAADG